MAHSYKRKVSPSERLWLVAARLCPPFSNIVILEGTGSLDIGYWQDAVHRASSVNPGSRLRISGVLGCSKWIDSGRTPAVKEIDGSSWDGKGPEGAPFLEDPFLLKDGHSCDVLLLHGDPLRVVFRSHHAVMDGRGTMVWMNDMFRCLRKEEPLGSYSRLYDRKLAQSFQKETRGAFAMEHGAPTGTASGQVPGVTWQRRKIKGKYSDLVGQMSLLIAAEARKHHQGVVRIGIPVDLRRRKPGLRSTANLTIAIYVEINQETTAADVGADIARQLEQGKDGVTTKSASLMNIIPLNIVQKGVEKLIRKQHRSGMYGLTGVISNMGRIDTSGCIGGGFSTKTCFFIPPGLDTLPVFFTLNGNGNTIELICTMPKALASKGRLKALMDKIVAGLESVQDKNYD